MLKSLLHTTSPATIDRSRISFASLGWAVAWGTDQLASGSTAPALPAYVGSDALQTTVAKQAKSSNYGCRGVSLMFDGTDDAFPVLCTAISGLTAYTVYVVSRATTLTAGGAVIFETTNAYYNKRGVVVGSSATGQVVVGTGTATTPNNKTTAAPVLERGVVSAGAFDRTLTGSAITRAYINGVAMVAPAETTTNTALGLNLGTGSWVGARNNGGSAPHTGHISFVGVRSGADSPQTVRQISDMLAQRWCVQ